MTDRMLDLSQFPVSPDVAERWARDKCVRVSLPPCPPPWFCANCGTELPRDRLGYCIYINPLGGHACLATCVACRLELAEPLYIGQRAKSTAQLRDEAAVWTAELMTIIAAKKAAAQQATTTEAA